MSDSEEECRRCEAPARFTCTSCKKAKYCGKKCQERDWCIHIFDCNTDKPIKTFHYLAKAIVEDLLPTDGPTLEVWGFNRAEACPESLPAQNYLFGLYVGLVNYCDVEPKTLDQWRRKGTLFSEIKSIYEAIPERSRGGYYPWLLRNEYVLDRSQPIPSDTHVTVAENILKQAWTYARGTPLNLPVQEIRKTINSWNEKKKECFLFSGMLLQGGRPGPDTAMWIHYGLCVGGLYQEMQMAEVYKSLIRKVSFEELLDAFQSSGVVRLITQQLPPLKFLDELEFKEFEDVMSTTSGEGMSKSVWTLKACVQQQVGMVKPDFQMTPAVRVDYGFFNCRNETDRRTLLGLYRLYFDSEHPKPRPLDLHEACIQGKLFEHLAMYPRVKVKEDHRRLLKNFNPLPDPDA